MHHGSFTIATKRVGKIQSICLDDLIKNFGSHDQVAFIHIDVEGMELVALRGANSILKKSRPIVVFECHIKTEKAMLSEIKKFFQKFDYKLAMINEMLPGCKLDCRNFLAYPIEKSNFIESLQVNISQSSVPYFFPCSVPTQNPLILIN